MSCDMPEPCRDCLSQELFAVVCVSRYEDNQRGEETFTTNPCVSDFEHVEPHTKGVTLAHSCPQTTVTLWVFCLNFAAVMKEAVVGFWHRNLAEPSFGHVALCGLFSD